MGVRAHQIEAAKHRPQPHDSDKAKAQFRHAQGRFLGRVEVELTKDLHAQLVKSIQNNELKFIERQSARVSIWQTTLNDTTVNLVYDKKRSTIVTVLIPEGKVVKVNHIAPATPPAHIKQDDLYPTKVSDHCRPPYEELRAVVVRLLYGKTQEYLMQTYGLSSEDADYYRGLLDRALKP